MKIKKKCQICTHAVWFYFILLVCAQFCNVIEKSQLFKSLKNVNNLWPMKNVRFEYIPWKKCLVLFHFHSLGSLLVIKLRKFDFEKHWDTSIFFDKKNTTSDLNMPHTKMTDFVTFSLFGFTLIIKLRNLDFERFWNIFGEKMMSALNAACQTVLILFKLRCLSSILTIIWKTLILNIFEIVQYFPIKEFIVRLKSVPVFLLSCLYFLALP